MFQDLLTAGDLFSYVQYKGGKLPDIEAAVIVRQVVIALDYLHSRNIVHRDLKPDNILMTSRADGCRVVLTDFGCATLVNSTSSRMSSMVGTFEFSAPLVYFPYRSLRLI
jgi:protein-serine/threonine kinase